MLVFKVKAVELIGKLGFNRSAKFRTMKSNLFTNVLWSAQRKFGTEHLESVIAKLKGNSPDNIAMDNYITENGLVRAINIFDIHNYEVKMEVIPLTTLIKQAKRTLA